MSKNRLKKPRLLAASRVGLLAMICLGGTMACEPEVGSESWCQQQKEKPKIDWTTREASAYAKHCIFK